MNTRQATAREAKGAIDVLEAMITDRNRAIALLLATARETLRQHPNCGPDDECAERLERLRESIRNAEHLES